MLRAYRCLALLLMLPGLSFLSGCGDPDETRAPVPESQGEISPAVQGDAWEGLLRPVAITADRDGRIYVGDQGDRTIKVFGPEGDPVSRFGGFGSGPGELTAIQGIVALEEEIVAGDPSSARLVRYALDGAFLGAIPNGDMADAIGKLGPDRIVVAGSPVWAMHAAIDQGGGALFQVMEPTGRVELSGGDRRPTENPFVGHIRNFVLPAGSNDGSFVWLARLNHPSVIRQPVSGGEGLTVERSIPFDWRELPPDFEPSPELMAQGADATPFDVLALDIATDSSDRAFVLTPLAPSGSGGIPPAAMGVDVLDPHEGWTHRVRIPDPATALAVSPDGSHLYLLDEATARIRVYGWSPDE